VDCSRAIHDQHLEKVVDPLKIVAVFKPSENSCQCSEESGHSSEKKNSLYVIHPELKSAIRYPRRADKHHILAIGLLQFPRHKRPP
jgi:hypothetical protein